MYRYLALCSPEYTNQTDASTQQIHQTEIKSITASNDPTAADPNVAAAPAVAKHYLDVLVMLNLLGQGLPTPS